MRAQTHKDSERRRQVYLEAALRVVCRQRAEKGEGPLLPAVMLKTYNIVVIRFVSIWLVCA